MAKHKYADLLIAYANDDSLQFECRLPGHSSWIENEHPRFTPNAEWRIKPTPKRAFVYMVKSSTCSHYYPQSYNNRDSAEDARKTAISFNYTVTDIKEVEFE